MITLRVDTDGVSQPYSTLLSAINAIPATLTDNYTIICEASTGVVDSFTGQGHTCNKTPAGFSITFDFRNNYELKGNVNGDYQYALRLKTTGVVNMTGDGTGKVTLVYDWDTYPSITQSRPVILIEANATTATHIFERINVRTITRGTSKFANHSGVIAAITTTVTSVTVRNINAWHEGWVSTGTSRLLLDIGAAASAIRYYNNTLVNGDFSLRATSTHGNNIVSSGRFLNNTLGVSLGGNRSEDQTSPDVAGRGQIFSFYSADSRNYRLKTYDAGAKNKGVDLTGQPNAPTTDIFGTTRPLGASWDSGAHETYASSITSITSPLVSGSTSNSLVTTSFSGTVNSLVIKDTNFSLNCTNITSTGGGNYTFDVPNMTAITVNTLGVPFTSEYWSSLEVQASDGSTLAQYIITHNPPVGYTTVDVSDIIDTSISSIFYGWTGTPARYDQILYPTTVTITGDGLLTTDLIEGSITLFYFDQTDGYWKPFVVTLSVPAGLGIVSSVVIDTISDVVSSVFEYNDIYY